MWTCRNVFTRNWSVTHKPMSPLFFSWILAKRGYANFCKFGSKFWSTNHRGLTVSIGDSRLNSATLRRLEPSCYFLAVFWASNKRQGLRANNSEVHALKNVKPQSFFSLNDTPYFSLSMWTGAGKRWSRCQREFGEQQDVNLCLEDSPARPSSDRRSAGRRTQWGVTNSPHSVAFQISFVSRGA